MATGARACSLNHRIRLLYLTAMELDAGTEQRKISAPANDQPNWFEGHVPQPVRKRHRHNSIQRRGPAGDAVNFATPGDLLG